VDPAMFAALHKQQDVTPKLEKLPDFLNEGFEHFFEPILEVEKEDYKDTLMPFSQYEEALKAEGKKAYLKLYKKLCHAQDLIEEKFKDEEKNDSSIAEEAKFQVWEKIATQLNEEFSSPKKAVEEKTTESEEIEENLNSIQENLGVTWSFMDRAYKFGSALLQEEKFEDAEDIFYFLRYLNGEVFEYWFGEAVCQQALSQYEDALNTYVISLFFQPENPVVFYQMANSYLGLEEKESAIAALETSIEYAQREQGNEELEQLASDLLHKLQAEKV
jgi:tetratricopeptide (TPR) repeat protein